MLISLQFVLINATFIFQIISAEKHILHDTPLDYENILKF